MDQDFFENVPSEIIINILSRLPVRTITISKCVCKPWLHLIEAPGFAKFHLSKSVPGLLVYKRSFNVFKIFDFEEVFEELEHHEELHYNRITKIYQDVLVTPSQSYIGTGGSVNGLLLIHDLSGETNDVYICNPITRESIHLPPSLDGILQYPTLDTYGFGVSKMSGEYKVVRICRELSILKSECHVYTLGTATWRSIVPPDDKCCYNSYPGLFVNGNLHWLVEDLKGSCRISCMNLETELFSSFSTPPDFPEISHGKVGNLEGCLCLCDNNTSEVEIVIWVMKEYGVETSWKKEFVITKIPDCAGGSIYPLKVFRDGDILMWWWEAWEVKEDLLYYYNKTETTRKFDMFRLGSSHHAEAMLHTSSFISLKDFVLENVTSFRVLISLYSECYGLLSKFGTSTTLKRSGQGE